MGKQGGTLPSHYHEVNYSHLLKLSKLANTKTFGCAGKRNKSDRKKQHMEGLPNTVFLFDTHTSLFLPSSDSLLVWTASYCSWLTWTIWKTMKWFQGTWKGLHVVITSSNRNNEPNTAPVPVLAVRRGFTGQWSARHPRSVDNTSNTQLDTHTQIYKYS